MSFRRQPLMQVQGLHLPALSGGRRGRRGRAGWGGFRYVGWRRRVSKSPAQARALGGRSAGQSRPKLSGDPMWSYGEECRRGGHCAPWPSKAYLPFAKSFSNQELWEASSRGWNGDCGSSLWSTSKAMTRVRADSHMRCCVSTSCPMNAAGPENLPNGNTDSIWSNCSSPMATRTSCGKSMHGSPSRMSRPSMRHEYLLGMAFITVDGLNLGGMCGCVHP